jgi:hypothetical protein
MTGFLEGVSQKKINFQSGHQPWLRLECENFARKEQWLHKWKQMVGGIGGKMLSIEKHGSWSGVRCLLEQQ